MNYFFIDESGDTTFFNKKGSCILGQEGVGKLLIIGFIKTKNPHEIRSKLNQLKKEISEDSYLKDIPSISKSKKHFHAKDDCPEVREKVFKTLKNLKFKSQFIVARKSLERFVKRHKRDEDLFYGEIMSRLLQNNLHKEDNVIYFSKRGSKTRQHYFQKAVDQAILNFEERGSKKVESETKVYVQISSDEPCLQVIDYMNWMVQRAIIKREMRFFDFLRDKVSLLVDIYDTTNYPHNFYDKRNEFDIEKISPL